jgi:hypothetical protein
VKCVDLRGDVSVVPMNRAYISAVRLILPGLLVSFSGWIGVCPGELQLAT